MHEDIELNGFVEGFAKVAEDAGFSGEQVRGLLELSVALARRDGHEASFDAGFRDFVMGR